MVFFMLYKCLHHKVLTVMQSLKTHLTLDAIKNKYFFFTSDRTFFFVQKINDDPDLWVGYIYTMAVWFYQILNLVVFSISYLWI